MFNPISIRSFYTLVEQFVPYDCLSRFILKSLGVLGNYNIVVMMKIIKYCLNFKFSSIEEFR